MSKEKIKVVVAGVRFLHPHVFTPSAPKLAQGGTADPRYKTRFFVQKTEGAKLDGLRQKIVEACRAEWPNVTDDELRGVLAETVLDGAVHNQRRAAKNKAPDTYLQDAFICGATSQYKPGIAGPDAQPIIDPAQFYGGCYGAIEVALNPYIDQKTAKKCCSLWLNYVLKTADGEPLGGTQRAAADVFAGILPSSTPVDPTGGGSTNPLW